MQFGISKSAGARHFMHAINSVVFLATGVLILK